MWKGFKTLLSACKHQNRQSTMAHSRACVAVTLLLFSKQATSSWIELVINPSPVPFQEVHTLAWVPGPIAWFRWLETGSHGHFLFGQRYRGCRAGKPSDEYIPVPMCMPVTKNWIHFAAVVCEHGNTIPTLLLTKVKKYNRYFHKEYYFRITKKAPIYCKGLHSIFQ